MDCFESLSSSEDVPVVIADNNGLIRSVNRCFLETFKWSQEDLLGELLTIIMPAKYRDSHSMGISRFLSTEIRTLPDHALDLEVVCGDGSTIISSHIIVAGKQGDDWFFAGKITPRGQH